MVVLGRKGDSGPSPVWTRPPYASPPVTLKASEVPLPEGEGLGGRRWFVRTEPRVKVVKAGARTTEPRILVVEARARTTLEKLLEKSRPSEAVPRLRSRRSEMLEADADEMEEQARQVDSVRRRKKPNREEEAQLREEANKLRVEAARLRIITDQLLN